MARLNFIGYLGYLFGQEEVRIDVKSIDELMSFLKSSKLKDTLFDEQGNLYEGILFMKNNEVINIAKYSKTTNSNVNKNVNIYTLEENEITISENDEITISLPTAGG
ncbi:ubiquitin family protein [Hydrogenobaculum acidophilum]